MITNAQLAHDGTYSVIVSNSYGAVPSSNAALVVLIRPRITLHPISQSVVAGGSVTLSASAEGNPLPLTFRWRKNSAFISNLLANGSDSFLTLTNLEPTPSTNQFYFSVGVTNLAGSSTLSSNAVITVVPDSDGDGIPDEWESANGLNVSDPADAALDSDGDGVSNHDEYLAGTDPHDPNSFLKIECLTTGSPPAALVRFSARAAKTYTVLRRDSLNAGTWISLADVPAAPSNRPVDLRDPMPPNSSQPQRFYRLVTPRLP